MTETKDAATLAKDAEALALANAMMAVVPEGTQGHELVAALSIILPYTFVALIKQEYRLIEYDRLFAHVRAQLIPTGGA